MDSLDQYVANVEKLGVVKRAREAIDAADKYHDLHSACWHMNEFLRGEELKLEKVDRELRNELGVSYSVGNDYFLRHSNGVGPCCLRFRMRHSELGKMLGLEHGIPAYSTSLDDTLPPTLFDPENDSHIESTEEDGNTLVFLENEAAAIAFLKFYIDRTKAEQTK
ncbi:MAG: hypothetical protein KJ709_02280 [Nanoarchaeota archaeon]|nr:hypothetical protein [Nanoarchaeota archaeon]